MPQEIGRSPYPERGELHWKSVYETVSFFTLSFFSFLLAPSNNFPQALIAPDWHRIRIKFRVRVKVCPSVTEKGRNWMWRGKKLLDKSDGTSRQVFKLTFSYFIFLTSKDHFSFFFCELCTFQLKKCATKVGEDLYDMSYLNSCKESSEFFKKN